MGEDLKTITKQKQHIANSREGSFELNVTEGI